MSLIAFAYRLSRRRFYLAIGVCLLVLPEALSAATDSKPLPQVPKWGRFEQSFRSSVAYANPVQDAALSVTFTSPLGETLKANGFWDGGKTWRVRFAPDQPGKWSFKTTFSDRTNSSLHNIAGEFLCTALTSKSRFDRHGPVQIARDRRHLEHRDWTPFFWLADTVSDGAVLAKANEWEYYAQARAQQKFSVAEWIAAPGRNLENETAYSGNARIVINPKFFQKLDARVEALNRAGILNAIVPLRDMVDEEALPEEQAILLLRYMVARWDANDVAWVVTCEGDNLGRNASRWKRIGRAVFGTGRHAPVILNAGETYWVLDEFRAERWVDAFGYQSGQLVNDDTLLWLLAGPVSRDWMKPPVRPFINLATAHENERPPQAQERADPLTVRRAVYWSLLNAPTAGVNYGGHGVCNWMTDSRSTTGDSLPVWQKALFMPAAKQMSSVAGLFNTIDFWRLRPAPEVLARQPGLESPSRHIAAAATEIGDVVLIYVPEDRSVEMTLAALPSSPKAIWINARTGERSPAVAVVGNTTCTFATPGAGDWLLYLKTSKDQP